MMRPRRSRDEGHKRKFLVVIDDTPECIRALTYAAKRADKTSGDVTMLMIIEPGDFQHWLGVEDIMRAEAMEEARSTLSRFAQTVREVSDVEPELVIRDGKSGEEIHDLIEEDEDIAVLVLGASESSEGPGPLVTTMAGKNAGTFPIPIMIIPATLSDEAMDAIA